jgi:carboxyl-terminal processing protease
MRRACALFAVFLLAALLAAAPVPVRNSSPPGGGEAEAFAQNLLGAVNQVVEQYVRHVSRTELLHAALAGLYERARLPVPPRLEAEIVAALLDWGDDGPKVPPLGPEKYEAVLRLLRRTRAEVGAAEALAGQDPLLVACHEMARSLDPYSGVVTAEEQRRSAALEWEVESVGLDLDDAPGGALVVRQVLPGGPAQRAGLRPGDEVTHLGGEPVGGLPRELTLARLGVPAPPDDPAAVVERPASPGGAAAVRVTFRRKGAPGPRTAPLRPERFHPETVLGVARNDDNTWEYFVDRRRRVAHVRLAGLARGTAREMRDVLDRLQEGGPLGGLLLDLRWCPGGYLDEAVDTARLFLPADGTIATVRSRQREDTVYRCTKDGAAGDFPVVVLVNGTTSGGGELIAAALQDHGRAAVAGQRTFGKASVQAPLYVGVPGAALKLTTGTFVRPSGKNLHRAPGGAPANDWGVRPDRGREFRVPADLGRALQEWWQQQTLRPGASEERLPLDDPSADPQRQAALRALWDKAAR